MRGLVVVTDRPLTQAILTKPAFSYWPSGFFILTNTLSF